MPTEEEIGKKIVKAVWMNKKHGDAFFDRLQKQLNKLNVKTTKETTKLYNKVLSSLDLKDKLVESSVDNLSKVRVLMLGIDDIQRIYKRQYGGLIREARKESQELLKARENRITKLLSKVGIVEQDRNLITEENFNLMEMLNTQGYKRINQTLEKWKNFAYDTFYIGVTRGMNIADFKSLFYTDSGTLKIGSSLVQESEMEMMISITEQRTAFLQQRAKELGYKCCWNSNPMDMRTKPECISASLAGVITEAAMGTDHGFPPRYICRCELVYTRCEWAGVNKGVNEAIAERRLYLLEELKSAPGQLAKWKRKGVPGWIVPKEELRAAGLKPYKEIEDKIKLVESKEVPGFEVKKELGEIVPGISVKSAEEILEHYEKSRAAAFIKGKSAEELKEDIAKRLSKRMDELNIPGWNELVNSLATNSEFAVSELINQWAVTSGDKNPNSIMMQLAAQKEFKLEGVSLWWHKGALKEATERLEKWEAPLRSFLREMYNDTQEHLRKQGLKSVRVARGYVGDIGIESSTMINKMTKVDIQLQPMSSFSSDFSVANSFSRRAFNQSSSMIFAEVPADRVLSCPITGFGCLNESEWVILGSQKIKSEKMIGSMITKERVDRGYFLMDLFLTEKEKDYTKNLIKEIYKKTK